MSAEERLIRYCSIDTQSDPTSAATPSTLKQFDLGNLLVKELKELGLEDACIDEHCYVYAHLPSNCGEVKKVGFIAHLDTSPDYSGAGVKPRIIECYDGGDIELCEGVVTRAADFPLLAMLKGKRLMVTDGSTLLGADDKAGITAVMEALAWWQEHPEVKHGEICVAFTPDEEIGNGTKYFDLEKFGADFGYTMDGGALQGYCDETFNAASAVVKFQGFTIHPGSAKNRMINAMNVAHEFHGMLPGYMRPEHTEDREGFIHLTNMSGACDTAVLKYIIRDHDADKLEEMIGIMHSAEDFLNCLYGAGTVTVEITYAYRNMKEIIDANPEVSERALRALNEIGYPPVRVAVRGGTDGAQLSFRGLPCPNLGTGAGNYHGRYEYCCIDELEDASRLIRTIAEELVPEDRR